MLVTIPTLTQSSPVGGGPNSATSPSLVSSQSSANEAYTLKRGDNEFGGWGGISFKATTIFAGLSDAEAADRKFYAGYSVFK